VSVDKGRDKGVTGVILAGPEQSQGYARQRSNDLTI